MSGPRSRALALGGFCSPHAGGKKLVYVGGVGTGFNERSGCKLREKLDGLIPSKPAATVDRKAAIFVKPKIIDEIKYRARTEDGLRHASHKGLRDKQDNAAIYEILPLNG